MLPKARAAGKNPVWINLMSRASLIAGKYEDPEQLRQVHGMNAAGSIMGRFEDTPLAQAGDAMQARAAVQTVNVVNKTVRSVKRDAVKIAEFYRVPVPRTKKYVLLMIFGPILLLTAIYIPKFMSSKSTADHIMTASIYMMKMPTAQPPI